MSSVDIISLIVIILLLLAIIFFSYIFPRIRHQKKSHCDSCYVVKHAKRLPKEYQKQKEKENKKNKE